MSSNLKRKCLSRTNPGFHTRPPSGESGVSHGIQGPSSQEGEVVSQGSRPASASSQRWHSAGSMPVTSNCNKEQTALLHGPCRWQAWLAHTRPPRHTLRHPGTRRATPARPDRTPLSTACPASRGFPADTQGPSHGTVTSTDQIWGPGTEEDEGGQSGPGGPWGEEAWPAGHSGAAMSQPSPQV